MMYSSTSASAAAAVLALITTTAQAAPALPVSSSTSTSTGFRLRVQSTSYSSAAAKYLTYQRLGTGFNFATVGSSGDGVFYQNGSDPSTSTIVTDVPGVYPLGLSVSLPGEVDSVGEHGVFVTLNGVTGGLSVNSAGVLGGPVDAEYLVCKRDVPGSTGPQSFEVVKVRYAGEEVPTGCEAVQFVAECAVLEELPEGSAWDHDDVVPVSCSPA